MQEGEEAQTVLTRNQSATGIKYDNVYITPSHIEFNEAIEGVTYRQRITMKNIGSKPAFIRIREPNSLAFQVRASKNGMRVSPGLNVTTCVIYCFKRPSLLRAIIPIEINGKIFDYHVICTLATEGISIEPKLIDFEIKINRFSIDLGQNDLDLTVKPLRGIVRPQKEVKLRIELIGTNEGTLYSEFWIKSVPNIRVPIKIIVIVPRLVVYHPNSTGDFTLIDFPPTIEHTNRYDTFVLRNLSSRVSSYVVLGELDNEVKCIRDIDRKCYPVYSAFEIHPHEGRMNPFQGSDPVKDSVADNIPSQRTYIQETTVETSSLSTTCVSNIDLGIRDVIRLCLYGEVHEARLQIEPNILYFVEASFKLVFDIKADSYNSCVPKRCLEKIKVGSYSVECTVNIIFKSKRELLSKRSLSIKATNDDEEIIKRVLHVPKWKLLYKKYSEQTADRLARCREFPLEKTASSIKAAVLISLSPLQIYKIHIYPTTFAFGNVASNSFNYRRLIVKNKNNVPVMIRLISLSSKCIRFPEGNLMILQPESTMTRLIEYFADEVGKFNGYIDYVINDNHSFELSITADVVHKQLHIDKREIELGKEWSSKETTYRPMISVVRITNKLSAKTYFRWEIPASSGFYIEPMSGSVRDNSTLHVYVHYEADNAKTNYAQAVLRCESGSYASLQLSAPRFAPRVEFVNDNANLGEIPLNLPTKVIAVLQNFEFNEVVYEVDSGSLIRGCDVNPLRGKISSRGIALVNKNFMKTIPFKKVLNLTLDACCRFSTAIAVTVQRNLRLLFRITGNVSFPRLKILPQRIDMKRIGTDAVQIRRITVTNIGTTMLKLQFFLEEYPEFRISLSNCNNFDIDAEGVTIAPGESQNLYLHFQPIDLASYAFYLPMVINRLLGPASMLNPKSIRPLEFLKSREMRYAHLPNFVITPLPDKLPTIAIDCTVANSVVFFSKLLFLFNTTTNKLVEELCIENRAVPRETVVTINIEEFNKVDCPFTIEWSRGVKVERTSDTVECTLHPGGNVFFVLEFKPKKRGRFSVEAPIYVRGELDGGVFNKLRLDGEFPASSIDVEPTEIYFTPVPLDTTIEENFRIRARHFDNAALVQSNFSIASRCNGDYKDELLQVDFPNGNVVHPESCVDLKGRITFKSEQPVSFCLTINFWDDRALAACSLKVYAIADNSLLTTYMYSMRSYLDDLDDTYVKYTEKRISHLSISSDSGVEEDDEGISRIWQFQKALSESFNVFHLAGRRSSIAKVTNLKLLYKEEMNINNNGVNGKDINGKWAADGNSKQISFQKRLSTFPVDSGTKNSMQSERLWQSYYSINDKKEIVTAAEEWMYSGPLKFHFYPNIPHGIIAAFSNFCIKRTSSVGNSKRKNNPVTPSFIDFLESLVGSDICNYLGELWRQPLPKDNIERINHVLQLYEKTLDFLLSRGAHLAHISARFLLNYDDYVINIDIVRDNARRKKSSDTNHTQCEQLPRHLFESRSKQFWLDVILQTYKCFQLHGIHERKFQLLPCLLMRSSKRSTMYRRDSTASPRPNLPNQHELHERAIRSISNMPSDKSTFGNRCAEERFLLAWLQYHYEQQRVQDWMADRRVILNPQEKHDVAEYREIQNFRRDLSDSLVLIAITAAYCPFLIDECFGNFYICPRNKEETLHNAICLVTAWRKIRLGFIITPMQLINPNEVQMLMLVVHLFQTLPTYIPRAKITFNCSLSQTVTRQISISNPTDNVENYLLLFMNNANRFFTVLKPTSILHVHAHGSGQIQIQFHAKKIRKIKAYLVLCGYAVGPNFGRNQTIVLEGHIDNLGIAKEYTIRSRLYEIVETSLKINVPYRNAAEYDIWMTDERPTHPSTLKMTRWCELRTRKIPRRLFLNQKSIIVAENALEAYLSLSVACIIPKQRTFWLIFQAKTGDFIVQINSIWQPFVSDRIVAEWATQGKCVCSNQRSGTCPFSITVSIPSRNAQLWKCVAEMFRKTLNVKERLFWSKYSDTYIELRLIRWLMGDDADSAAMEFAHIFNTTVTYKVTSSSKSSTLVLSDSFTIQDVRPSAKQVPMIIHILPTTSPLYESTISLTSLDGNELRVYTVNCLRLIIIFNDF
ncbi:hypothetical protein X777_01388 [Ooceraea biroi]|uniref:Calponin-homology (CH) domain-containing protein n=1 Tax=Ooceraea biroi TaxID=2015173 RepID=A0A026WPM4_OOCBI|nr:hypothetical protein X777_01388 [Ooceraea biroi]